MGPTRPSGPRQSVVKKLPRSKRDLIYKVIDSRSPHDLVGYLIENIEL